MRIFPKNGRNGIWVLITLIDGNFFAYALIENWNYFSKYIPGQM